VIKFPAQRSHCAYFTVAPHSLRMRRVAFGGVHLERHSEASHEMLEVIRVTMIASRNSGLLP